MNRWDKHIFLTFLIDKNRKGTMLIVQIFFGIEYFKVTVYNSHHEIHSPIDRNGVEKSD